MPNDYAADEELCFRCEGDRRVEVEAKLQCFLVGYTQMALTLEEQDALVIYRLQGLVPQSQARRERAKAFPRKKGIHVHLPFASRKPSDPDQH